MDESAATRPLDEAADSIRRLVDYEAPGELADAIQAVAAAIERVLRIALRNDATAPESHRLVGLAPDQLALDEVVKSLRTRDLISLEAAGTVHHVQAAVERAREGRPRPTDADVAREAVRRLRTELGSGPASAASPAGAAEVEPEEAEAADPGGSANGPSERAGPTVGRWMAWLAAGLAALIVVGAAWVLTVGGNEDYRDAVAAFRAGRLDSAAAQFERVRADRPQDVSVLLYLGRIYRRLERPGDAAVVLREAVAVAGSDPDVRREMGHLFMDLGRPRAAMGQYERALEQEPDAALNWAALIRALRELDDPRAEELLRDAPPEVQAALGGG